MKSEPIHIQEENLLKLQRNRLRRLHRVFSGPDGEDVLKDLENHFEVHLPAFQGRAGGFDPLDAMRRDAYREVFLYIRHQLSAGQDGTEEDNETSQP